MTAQKWGSEGKDVKTSMFIGTLRTEKVSREPEHKVKGWSGGGGGGESLGAKVPGNNWGEKVGGVWGGV